MAEPSGGRSFAAAVQEGIRNLGETYMEKKVRISINIDGSDEAWEKARRNSELVKAWLRGCVRRQSEKRVEEDGVFTEVSVLSSPADRSSSP